MTERRRSFRRSLNPHYALLYDALCERLGDVWQPYSGFRSIEEQDSKYAQGRTKPGGIVTHARGGESAHNYGCATDWTKWDGNRPLWMPKDAKDWEEYTNACYAVGLRPGVEFGDVNHNELVITVRWKQVGKVLREQGLSAATKLIDKSIVS